MTCRAQEINLWSEFGDGEKTQHDIAVAPEMAEIKAISSLYPGKSVDLYLCRGDGCRIIDNTVKWNSEHTFTYFENLYSFNKCSLTKFSDQISESQYSVQNGGGGIFITLFTW